VRKLRQAARFPDRDRGGLFATSARGPLSRHDDRLRPDSRAAADARATVDSRQTGNAQRSGRRIASDDDRHCAARTLGPGRGLQRTARNTDDSRVPNPRQRLPVSPITARDRSAAWPGRHGRHAALAPQKNHGGHRSPRHRTVEPRTDQGERITGERSRRSRASRSWSSVFGLVAHFRPVRRAREHPSLEASTRERGAHFAS